MTSSIRKIRAIIDITLPDGLPEEIVKEIIDVTGDRVNEVMSGGLTLTDPRMQEKELKTQFSYKVRVVE